MGKILITGANGYIGSKVFKRLGEDGKQVVALNREEYPYDNLDKLSKFVKDFEVVIHLGGVRKGETLELVEGNLNSTISLLEALSVSRACKKFIFASSFSVYPSLKEKITEEVAPDPRNIYGWSKLWAEEAIMYYSKQIGFSYDILRISNVYGEDEPKEKNSVISLFIDKAKANLPIQINGDGEQIRDFIYIDDVVEAIISCASSDSQKGRVLNICSSEAISMNMIINNIGKLKGSEIKSEHKIELQDNTTFVGDNSKAQDELHWEPKITFTEGIEKIWDTR